MSFEAFSAVTFGATIYVAAATPGPGTRRAGGTATTRRTALHWKKMYLNYIIDQSDSIQSFIPWHFRVK